MTVTLRLESYDAEARTHIKSCQALADNRHHSEVEPIHLWFRLIDKSTHAQSIVEESGANAEDILVETEWLLRKIRNSKSKEAYLSSRLLELLGRAEGEAARDGGAAVSTQHLLMACAQEATGALRAVMRTSGLSAPILRAMLRRSEKTTNTMKSTSADKDPVDAFGQDLTQLAAEGRFDPTVARDGELRRILQVLARRDENNPLLVGEPGIGKGSIVRALATRIAQGDVPKMLEGKRIVELDMSRMLAGTKLRGQLEERMRNVLDKIAASHGQTILYLPSLTSLVKGKNGAADMLASAMSRGQIRSIAICTPDELRTAQDADSPLLRKFVPIAVEPPSIDDAIAILRGVVDGFEIAHGVRITDPALVAAVNFARRYVSGVQLPKAAIDLIDEGAARVRVEMESVPAELDTLTRRLEAVNIQSASLKDDHDKSSSETKAKLDAEAKALLPKIEAMREIWEAELAKATEVRSIKAEIAEAQQSLEQARVNDNQEKIAEFNGKTVPALQTKLNNATEGADATSVHDTVGPEDIAEVVALWTGVPVVKMLEGEAEKLLQMEERLTERVVGQSEAVVALSKAVRRGRVGLRDPKRPIGSFLFLGPTGVGKTELAKALAEFLFDDEAALTRLDMSEFMEKHMVARLLGSPPGYVDSEAGGFLTEAVRQRPYSVVLFDEMEKAHPDVFNILLQVLDDGRLTDSRGRLAHFRDTVVIMTSNVGSEIILDHEGTNEELKAKIQAVVHDHFRPEFLNRIDDILIFDPLGKESLAKIVDIQLRDVQKLLAHRRITLSVSDAAKAQIVELGYQPAFGARPLKRVILKELQDPLAETLLRGGYQDGATVNVDFDGNEFTFNKG